MRGPRTASLLAEVKAVLKKREVTNYQLFKELFDLLHSEDKTKPNLTPSVVGKWMNGDSNPNSEYTIALMQWKTNQAANKQSK